MLAERTVTSQLQDTGYAVIPGVLDTAEVEQYLGYANNLFDRHGTHPLYEGYADHVYNLARQTHWFNPLFEHPLVMETLDDVLGHDFTLSQTELRRPILNPKGGSANVWHRDTRYSAPGLWITAFWPLEDVTETNGPTLIRPKSHNEYGLVFHERVLTADAGDLILMDANLLHMSAPTQDGTSRWVVINTYNRWWIKPAIDHTRIGYRNYHSVSQMSQGLRQLYGFTSIPPSDERKRTHTCRPWEEIAGEL